MGSSWVIAGGLTLCGNAPETPTTEVVFVFSTGLVSKKAMLDFRDGLGPAE